MAEYGPKDIRNVAFVSHSGAGKTSIVDSIVYYSGSATRLGKVDDGTSVSDYDPDEIARKISINSSALHCVWNHTHLNIIDTPGYADFAGEVISALEAVDCAVLVICAVSGIEVGTDKAWGFLEERNLPRLIFINRLDKENADFFKVLDAIHVSFGKKCVPITYPFGKESSFTGAVNLVEDGLDKLDSTDKDRASGYRESLIEAVAETDDALLEKYLAGEKLEIDEIKKDIGKSVRTGKLIPVLCGTAWNESVIKNLLNTITFYLPSPIDSPAKEASNPVTKESKTIQPDPKGPFSAQVFKTISDPYVGHLSLFRVFCGTLQSDTGFYNATRGTKERIGQIYLLHGKEQKPVASVQAGDIAAVAKLKETSTGDTICDEKSIIIYKPITFPEPAISFSVKPKTRSDEEKISGSLAKLSVEDQTFKVTIDTQTKELIISGMGDLHLEVMISRLKKKFNVDVEVGIPKVAYKETVQKIAKVQGKYKKQSGGRGQYGDVWLEIDPLPKGKGFEFVDKVVGGSVPRQYIPAVEKGVVDAMAEGVVAGCPVVDVRVILYDGSYHTVDSSELAFKIAGSMALKKGIMEASPVLLEPIMNIEVIVPAEYMGAITGDLNSRRGRIQGIESRSSLQIIKATVPLADVLKYATELRSMTGGRGSYQMKFSHYEEVPQRIATTIIAQQKKKEE